MSCAGLDSSLDQVQSVELLLYWANVDQIAASGHAVLVEFEIRGDPDDAVDRIGPVLDRWTSPSRATIGACSSASLGDVQRAARCRRRRLPTISAGRASSPSPITLAILRACLRLAHRGRDPRVLALTAVFGTFGLVAFFSHMLPTALHRLPRSCSLSGSRWALTTLAVLLEARPRGWCCLKYNSRRRRGRRRDPLGWLRADHRPHRHAMAMAGMFLTGGPATSPRWRIAHHYGLFAMAVLGSR